jgi:anti-sigma factor RsiW
MNHPSREEWAAYVCGEGAEHERRERREHLAQCPACAGQVAAWEAASQRLKLWDFPIAPMAPALVPAAQMAAAFPIRAERRRPWLGWAAAAAAALVAAGGFLVGQWTTERSLRADVGRMLAEDRVTARADARDMLASLSTMLERSRTADRAAILAMFRSAEERHAAAYVALRRDLETLASMTDEEFQRARLKLAQMAAVSRPD